MNTKDYQAIAEIINNNEITKEGKSIGLSYFGIVSDLANHFEKERQIVINKEKIESKGKTRSSYTLPFNKPQFLKDCGIEDFDPTKNSKEFSIKSGVIEWNNT